MKARFSFQGIQYHKLCLFVCFMLMLLSYQEAGKAEALKFSLEAFKVRCLREDLRPDVLVMGGYAADYFPRMFMKFWVADPQGQHIYSNEDGDGLEGTFAFTTEKGGEFSFCFHDVAPEDAIDDLMWRLEPLAQEVNGGLNDKEEGEEGEQTETEDNSEEEKSTKTRKAIRARNAPQDYQRTVNLHIRVGSDAKSYNLGTKKEEMSSIELKVRKAADGVTDILADMLYLVDREAKMRITNESTNERVMWLSVFSMVFLCVLTCWQIYYLRSFFRSKKLI